jgi:hypothetical protein
MTEEELSIFPLVTYNPETKVWSCLGTGFFTQTKGTFVTAKHVFIDENIQHEPTLYGVQATRNNERHLRPVEEIVYHPDADVMIGRLGERRLRFGFNMPATDSPCLDITNASLNAGDEIKTFAYPKTLTINHTAGMIMGFRGVWSNGNVVDFHKNGSSIVKNKCYQTTMHIEGGASGGPVLKNGLVVGINSSSYNLAKGEEPISYITPIDYVTDLIETRIGIQLKAKRIK